MDSAVHVRTGLAGLFNVVLRIDWESSWKSMMDRKRSGWILSLVVTERICAKLVFNRRLPRSKSTRAAMNLVSFILHCLWASLEVVMRPWLMVYW